MSGNLWMFSDKLDDEDIEIMKHEFITYYQGADYYGLGLKMFTRLAHEAGAVYKIGKKVLIRRTIFDEYLRQQYRIEQTESSLAADGKEASTRQGTLVLDTDSGRMNIRLGLNDYYGFLSCGTRMEVQIDGEWIPTRLEMADNWILIGIEAKDITGLTVRIKSDAATNTTMHSRILPESLILNFSPIGGDNFSFARSDRIAPHNLI